MPLSFTHPDETGPINYIAKPSLFAGTPFSQSYAQRVIATNPIAYWIQGEAAGLTAIDQINSPAQDGTYTGVTLGQAGIGDGNTCPLFDGANDYNNIYSAAFDAAFDGDVGSFLLWMFPTNWAAGAVTQPLTFTSTVNDTLHIRKNGANAVRFVSILNGGFVAYNYPVPAGERVIFLPVVMTWNWDGAKTDVECWVNGDLKNTINNANQWQNVLSNTATVVGAANATPVSAFDGRVAHVSVWDRVLTPAEIVSLSAVEV